MRQGSGVMHFHYMRVAYILLLAATLWAAQTKPTGPKKSDAQIEETIRASYAKSKIGVDHFTVHVKNGVAVIEGKTEIIQRKGWATRYAKLGGASQVNNNIQISEGAKQKARAKLAAARDKYPVMAAKQRQPKFAPTLAAAASAQLPPAPPPGPRRAIIRH